MRRTNPRCFAWLSIGCFFVCQWESASRSSDCRRVKTRLWTLQMKCENVARLDPMIRCRAKHWRGGAMFLLTDRKHVNMKLSCTFNQYVHYHRWFWHASYNDELVLLSLAAASSCWVKTFVFSCFSLQIDTKRERDGSRETKEEEKEEKALVDIFL